MRSLPLLTAVAALVAAPAIAAPARSTTERQASIPFVDHGGIRDWRAAGPDTLYVQDRSRNWYRADLMGPCLDLPFAQAIGFETRGVDRFDRFSTVRVRGQRCAVQSLVRSDPPTERRRGRQPG